MAYEMIFDDSVVRFNKSLLRLLRAMKVCGLVVRVSGYRYRGPGFDPPALPDFLSSSGSGTGSTQPS